MCDMQKSNVHFRHFSQLQMLNLSLALTTRRQLLCSTTWGQQMLYNEWHFHREATVDFRPLWMILSPHTRTNSFSNRVLSINLEKVDNILITDHIPQSWDLILIWFRKVEIPNEVGSCTCKCDRKQTLKVNESYCVVLSAWWEKGE